MKLLWVFVDGVGLGADDPDENPLLAAACPTVSSLLGGRPLSASGVAGLTGAEPALTVAADATLGVPGLPQSASGQTALFTGRNGARILGHHQNAFPGPTLRRVLAESSVFRRVAADGGRVTFLNPFPPDFLFRAERGEARLSATTCAILAAGVPLRRLDHVAGGQAVSSDIRGERFRSRGYPLPLVTPATAGATAARVAAQHDLTLFEYFRTDLAGHAQDRLAAVASLADLDEFLGAALASEPGVSLLLTSDHGNVEDLTTRSHTGNLVPVLATGGARPVAAACGSLLQVAPAVWRLWRQHCS